MRRGYQKTWELLDNNRLREESLAERFETLAQEQSDPALRQILGDIALRCKKNSGKIEQMFEALSAETYQVMLRCPICGWAIPFGSDPAVGTEAKCELCAIWFRLEEREGNYFLKKIGKKDGQ
ncbi:MAG: hypothetical protein JW950_08945 [Deltaproteobacteria bacterium]|nr:hypothetical protein [Deltaproteobacteria bacterium]